MLSQLLKALESYLMRTLFFESQVNSVIQSGYINLRAIASKFNFNLKKQQLINCLIFSKVDYCNCLFVGLPDSKSMRSKKLHKLQNAFVRFLFGKGLDTESMLLHFLRRLIFYQYNSLSTIK